MWLGFKACHQIRYFLLRHLSIKILILLQILLDLGSVFWLPVHASSGVWDQESMSFDENTARLSRTSHRQQNFQGKPGSSDDKRSSTLLLKMTSHWNKWALEPFLELKPRTLSRRTGREVEKSGMPSTFAKPQQKAALGPFSWQKCAWNQGKIRRKKTEFNLRNEKSKKEKSWESVC